MKKIQLIISSLALLLIAHGSVLAAATATPATATPAVPAISLPSTSQLTGWFNPLLAKIEAFRIKEAASYAALRDQTKVALGITDIKKPTVASDGLPPLQFDSPMQYLTLIYATACAAFFGNSLVFYISIILVVLLLLRSIVNFFV